MADAAGIRSKLEELVAAFEAHLDAAELRTGEADPAVYVAYSRLADAFSDYEEAVYEAYDEVVPMSLLDEDDEEDDEDDDDLEDLDDVDDLGDDVVDVVGTDDVVDGNGIS